MIRSHPLRHFFLASTLLLGGCDGILQVDNFKEPSSWLTGRIEYQGEALNLRGNGISLQLWEPGWDLYDDVLVNANQNGEFSAIVFDGDYKLNLIPDQGPWLMPDTQFIQVRGNTTVNFEVTPYYTVSDAGFSYVPAGPDVDGPEGRIQGTFRINTIIPEGDPNWRALEWAGLYVNGTLFVDRTRMIVRAEVNEDGLPEDWASAPITLSVALPEGIRLLPSPEPRTYVFARVGVKVAGIGEMIFSPVVKVDI